LNSPKEDEMGGVAKNRRRNYFIKKKFQAEFITKFCLLVIVGAALSGIIIYLMSKATVTTTFENSRLVIKSTADFMLPAVLLSSVIVIIFIGMLTIALTLFTSHRIAGPLYRMEQDIEEVASGNLTKKFNIRKTDEIRALATGLDRMTQSFNKNIADIKKDLAGLDSTLGTYEKSDKTEVMNELKKRITDLKSALTKFTT
jgi:signal transduction histidine kinase